MTKEELTVLLRNPNQTGLAVDELNRLIVEYPYFHTGHLLYLKSLQQTDTLKMALQLKETALSVRDRDILYRYIKLSSSKTGDSDIQSDTFIPPKPLDADEEFEIPKETDEIPDETPKGKSTDQGKTVWTSAELIDFFLKANPKIVPNDSQYEVDLSESLQEDREIVTETLADIYLMQGHKDKAIEIYEQLILKYPEKNIYFAAQIERLKFN